MTEGQIEQFRKLCLETQLSYKDIAEKFPGMSRNAAIGRARRMGLADLRPISTNNRKENRVKPRPNPTRFPKSRAADAPDELPTLVTLPEHTCTPVPFLEVTGCRWPMDGYTKSDMCCNNPRAERSWYCAHHLARSLANPSPKKRKTNAR